jgi:hypothetical protein
VHVYQTSEKHSTDGLDCWCSPRYGLSCTQCTTAEEADACWKCDGGLLTITRDQAARCPERVIIVHNR